MNKQIDEAIKDIESFLKEFPDDAERIERYWLRRLFQKGYIAGLEWTIENRKKHEH